MSMQVEVNISLILALVSLVGTVISSTVFIMKLRWDIGQQKTEIDLVKVDINNLGQKMDKSIETMAQKITEQRLMDSNEMRHIAIRVDAIDKAVVALQLQVGYIGDTVKELKEKLFKNTAII